MHNIYDIFESMKNYQLELQYDRLIESCSVIDVICEESNDNKNMISKLIDSLKSILESINKWLTNLIRNFREKYNKYTLFLKLHDMNSIATKLKSSNCNVKVQMHEFSPIESVQRAFKGDLKNMSKVIFNGNTRRNAYDKILIYKAISGCFSEDELEPTIKYNFNIDDEPKTILLTDINFVTGVNYLLNGNKVLNELESYKQEIEDNINKKIKELEKAEEINTKEITFMKEGIKIQQKYVSIFFTCLNKSVNDYYIVFKKMVEESKKIK